jgi:hypothetical protein
VADDDGTMTEIVLAHVAAPAHLDEAMALVHDRLHDKVAVKGSPVHDSPDHCGVVWQEYDRDEGLTWLRDAARLHPAGAAAYGTTSALLQLHGGTLLVGFLEYVPVPQ